MALRKVPRLTGSTVDREAISHSYSSKIEPFAVNQEAVDFSMHAGQTVRVGVALKKGEQR